MKPAYLYYKRRAHMNPAASRLQIQFIQEIDVPTQLTYIIVF